MKYIKAYIITAAIALFGVIAAIVPATEAAAINPLEGACSGNTTSEVCKKKDEKVEPILTTIVNVLLYIVGAVSVVMIIVAGILYSISGGDSGRVSKAKNMLTYAIVGLVVAFIAFAVVNWVLTQFK